MNESQELRAQVDEEGRLVLPAGVASRYGLKPGAQVCIEEATNSLRLRRPVRYLAKVYIEPTNRCNLECRTCIRNVWDEPLGQMDEATFARICESLQAFSPRPTVFFGGLGEPLAHPHIVEMVTQVKALDAPVELITNGTLLTEKLSRQLIAAGLDILWVSLDGATSETYTDVRLGAVLPQVLANIACFRDTRLSATFPQQHADSARFNGAPPTPDHIRPEIGIVFVAMQRNVADLPNVLRLGHHLGVTRFLVSHVLPYTAELRADVLYACFRGDISDSPSVWLPYLNLPRFDATDVIREPLYQVMRGNWKVSLAGNDLGRFTDRCPFVESGVTAISWNGDVSPCLPLLHNHSSFLDERERFSRHYTVGNVTEADLSDLWESPDYVAFRERVHTFDYPPCTRCGGCELALTNEEDCFGDAFPTCGGCLWAQGVIQCP